MSHDSHPNSEADFKEPFDALDMALAASIVQGPVPEGLSERLLAALHSEALRSESVQSGSCAMDVLERPAARRHWRRATGVRWATAAAALAAAACFAAILAFRPSQPLSYELLVAQANAFDASLAADQWRSVAKNPPNQWYKMSPALAATRIRWQAAKKFLGRDGVAYQVVSGGGVKGVLYVVPLNPVGGAELQGVGKSAPARPLMTGGKATAAWTDGTRLWVLVVEGGEREYRSFRPTGLA